MSASADAGISVVSVLGAIILLCMLRQLCSPRWCCPRKWCPCADPPSRARGHRRVPLADEGSDDEERGSPTPQEVALQEAERREVALARKVAATQAELEKGKRELAQTQMVKEVLTGRLGTARGGGPSLTPSTAPAAPSLSAREIKFHERGREIYGAAWDEPSEPGGMSLSETLSLPLAEVKALQAQARQVLTERDTARRPSGASRMSQFATPRGGFSEPAVPPLPSPPSPPSSPSPPPPTLPPATATRRVSFVPQPPKGPPPRIPKLDLSTIAKLQ